MKGSIHVCKVKEKLGFASTSLMLANLMCPMISSKFLNKYKSAISTNMCMILLYEKVKLNVYKRLFDNECLISIHDISSYSCI